VQEQESVGGKETEFTGKRTAVLRRTRPRQIEH
jgi:hypothetical protein